MLATGHHQGEFYRLDQVGADVRLETKGRHGVGLAVALGGRRTPRTSIFFLSPARADKWRALFLAGFTARRRMGAGVVGWVFELGGERLLLADAMRKARV